MVNNVVIFNRWQVTTKNVDTKAQACLIAVRRYSHATSL